MIHPEKFHNHYSELLYGLLGGKTSNPRWTLNRRTGVRVAVLPDAFDSFSVDLRDGTLPLPGNRRMHPKTAAAEVAWFLSGEQSVAWLRKHAPIWDKFVEEDGVTVDGAYGYRWRRHFGRDQVDLAIAALRADATDRRVLVSAWDPAGDGLGTPSRCVPCPTHFTLAVDTTHEDTEAWSLNMAVFVRSSDVFVGLPYDVMGHALLLNVFAVDLGLRPGVMHFTLAHPHLYESHLEMAIESLRQPVMADLPTIPEWSVRGVEDRPDDYVQAVADRALSKVQHPFNPRPEVVQ